MQLDKEIMLIFQTDTTIYKMYQRIRELGGSTDEANRVFIALKVLGLITSTNDQNTVRETLCVTKKGRAYMKSVYGITLPEMRMPNVKVPTAT